VKKIMFVCHGNICRSPMAEFVFKHLARLSGAEDMFHVASCATSREEIVGNIGNPIYPPARAELVRRNIPFTDRRAVQLKKSDYSGYDLFVAMDDNNIRNIRSIFGSDPQGKVKKLMDFTSRGGSVADPWYTGGFDKAFDDIYEGCAALLSLLKGGQANDGD
jgi:protein-tyrosine phosphatase